MIAPRIRSRALALALALATLGGTANAAKPPAEKQELDALRQRLEKLKRDTAAAEGSRAEAADQLKESEQAISETARALRQLGERQGELRREIKENESQARRLEADIAARDREVGRMLYDRYVNGEPDALRLLLSGVDPQRVARELHYLEHLSRAQSGVIQSLRADVEALKRVAEATREKSSELGAVENKRRDEQSKLEDRRREQRAVLERLSTQIVTQRREIETLQRNEQRLARLVDNLTRLLREQAERERLERQKAERARREQQAARPNEARRGPSDAVVRNDKVPEAGDDGGVASIGRGRMRLPVRGEITSRFGTARGEGGPSWKGIFIRAATGQEVRAVGAGRVVFADWMRGFGNLMIIDHGQGVLSIYGNNESLLKRAGDRVSVGDAVATVGASGGSEHSGLYFELRQQGRPVDPLTWIPR